MSMIARSWIVPGLLPHCYKHYVTCEHLSGGREEQPNINHAVAALLADHEAFAHGAGQSAQVEVPAGIFCKAGGIFGAAAVKKPSQVGDAVIVLLVNPQTCDLRP